LRNPGQICISLEVFNTIAVGGIEQRIAGSASAG